MRKLILLMCLMSGSAFIASAQKGEVQAIDTTNILPEKVFTAVEKMPEYPGGINALIHYLSNNIHYPEEARKLNIQGKVIIKFVVDKDGSIKNVQLVKGITWDCDREALRVVKEMPKWKPGTQNGDFVRVYYTLPISFSLRN